MKPTAVRQSETYSSVEDYEKNCYLFSQSISRRRIVGGKTHYVRRFFRGDKDFEQAMTVLASKQANKNER